MNALRFGFLLLMAMSSSYIVNAQQSGDSVIIGTWKGTSICQVKKQPCNDEMVVYYISKSNGNNEYLVRMNKTMDGAQEESGTLTFFWNPSSKELTCSINSKANWKFIVKDRHMDGTLYFNNELYRTISVDRAE